MFNADETDKFYKLLPKKSSTFKNGMRTDGKCSKERITVVVRANVVGSEKLQLLANFRYPKCFKQITWLHAE